MGSGLFGIYALYIGILRFYSSNMAIGCNIFYLLDFLFQPELKGWFQIETGLGPWYQLFLPFSFEHQQTYTIFPFS